jgi:hypothetical protein
LLNSRPNTDEMGIAMAPSKDTTRIAGGETGAP